MRATACPDTSGRTPHLYCTACAPTSPASRARIRRSCARGLNSWLNPPPASRQPPSPRVLREAMAAFLCVGRPPTATRATSHAACQPCMCEWPARDPTPQWQCAVRSGEWASPSRSRQWRSALRRPQRRSTSSFEDRGSSASGRARGSASVPAPPATAKYSDFLARHASISLRDQRKVHVGHPHIMEAADISRPVRGAREASVAGEGDGWVTRQAAVLRRVRRVPANAAGAAARALCDASVAARRIEPETGSCVSSAHTHTQLMWVVIARRCCARARPCTGPPPRWRSRCVRSRA